MYSPRSTLNIHALKYAIFAKLMQRFILHVTFGLGKQVSK